MTLREEPIPISALEHHLYCPRHCALIHVDGLWVDNSHTVRGATGHQRVDTGRSRSERGRLVLRGIPLWSEQHGLSGRADVVEVHPGGRVVPVEYKIGRRHGQAADVQLCAQALCLEEMFDVGVPTGALWYSTPRRRVDIEIDGTLRAFTLRLVDEIRSWLDSRTLPSPVDDERCGECQFLEQCLPNLVADRARLHRYMREVVFGCAP